MIKKITSILLLLICSYTYGQKQITIILGSGSGGGGGNTIYTANDALISPRIVDLNANSLTFAENGNSFLTIDPTSGSESVSIEAYNITGSSNSGSFLSQTTDASGYFKVQSYFNGGAKLTTIEGFADATTSTLTHTADTHTFNAPVSLTVNNGSDDVLNIDAPGFLSRLSSTDGTAETQFLAKSATGDIIRFLISSSDGSEEVKIEGNPVDNTITHTADTILLNSTLSGASSGYVWKLADATTGSGYWGAAAATTANNGLTMSTATNVQLGGTLTQATTIAKANNAFTMNGKGNITLEEIDIDGANATANITLQSSTGGNLPFIQMNAFDLDNTNLSTFSLSSTGMGIDISSVSSGGTSVFLQPSNNSVALSDPSGSTTSFFQKLSGGDTTTTITTQNGVTGKTTSITMPDSALIVVSVTPGNVVNTSFYLQRQLSTGSVGDGLGQALSFRLPTTTGIDNANKIISKWTTAADATRTSEISITGVNSAVTQTLLTLSGNGEVIINSGALRLKGYTVATLPAGVQGDFAFVTDALAPAYHVTVVGGGAVIVPVFFNGTNWIVN